GGVCARAPRGGGMSTIRVLLADDHALLRAGVRALLEKLPGIEIAAEAGDTREALALAEQRRPDVVLMDLAMPGLGGLGATAPAARDLASGRRGAHHQADRPDARHQPQDRGEPAGPADETPGRPRRRQPGSPRLPVRPDRGQSVTRPLPSPAVRGFLRPLGGF